MDDVICSGSEADVLDCPHITTHNCGPSEGAGVRCNTGQYQHRHQGLHPRLPVSLMSSGESEGNVMINNRPVCDQGWDDEDARVVCRMLGYESGEAVSGSQYGEVRSSFLMTDVSCDGTEEDLLSCGHSLQPDCEPAQAAGVICRERQVMAQVKGILLIQSSHAALCFSGQPTENSSR